MLEISVAPAVLDMYGLRKLLAPRDNSQETYASNIGQPSLSFSAAQRVHRELMDI
jgi:hypothetical protein